VPEMLTLIKLANRWGQETGRSQSDFMTELISSFWLGKIEITAEHIHHDLRLYFLNKIVSRGDAFNVYFEVKNNCDGSATISTFPDIIVKCDADELNNSELSQAFDALAMCNFSDFPEGVREPFLLLKITPVEFFKWYQSSELRPRPPVERIWAAASESHLSYNTAKKGRKPKYNWDKFDEELDDLISYHGGVDPMCDEFNTQAAYEKTMLNWCQNKWGDNCPAESSIRERVVQGFKRYSEGQKGQK
jgi:hypothetical protein